MSPKYLLVRNYPTMSSIVQFDNVRYCGINQLCFPYVHFKGRWKLRNYPIIFSICPFWGKVKIMEFSSYFSTVHFDYVWDLWNYPIIFSICPFWGRIGSQCLSAIEPTIATALHNIEAQILPRSIINKHSLFGVVFTTRDISNKRIPGIDHLWQCQPSSLSNQ